MAIISVSRPTNRDCDRLVQSSNVPLFSPIYAFDSSEKETIIDENGNNPGDNTFTGNVYEWRDLSGNNNHLNREGSTQNQILYSENSADKVPFNSSVCYRGGSGGNSDLTRLQHSRDNILVDTSLDIIFYAGFTEEVTSINNFSSLFSSGDRSSEGYFQLGNRDGDFKLLVEGQEPIELSPLTPGLSFFRIQFDSQTRTITVYKDGNLVASVPNSNLSLGQLKLFVNRNNDNANDTDFRYFYLYDRLLSDAEFTRFYNYHSCKWLSVESKVYRFGVLDSVRKIPLNTSWGYAANYISPEPYDRKVSLLRAVVTPSVFGQNFSARLYTGDLGDTEPGGASLMAGLGGGIGEAFASSGSKAEQIIQFATFNSFADFDNISVEIPANTPAWVAITAETPFQMGVSDISGFSLYEDTGHNTNASPHDRGDAWIPNNNLFAIEMGFIRL